MHGYDWFQRGFCTEGFLHGYFNFWFMGLIVLIIGILIYFSYKRSRFNGTNSAMDALKLMYVKGEITEEEFQQRRQVISKK